MGDLAKMPLGALVPATFRLLLRGHLAAKESGALEDLVSSRPE